PASTTLHCPCSPSSASSRRARPTASADVAAAARRYCNGAKTLQRRDGTAVAQRHRGGAVRSPQSPSFKASRRLSKLLSPSFKAELRFRFEAGSISERALDRRLRRALGATWAFVSGEPVVQRPIRFSRRGNREKPTPR